MVLQLVTVEYILDVAGFALIWLFGYKNMLEIHFWQKGDALLIAIYAAILFGFFLVYGAGKVGYLRSFEIFLSHAFSILAANTIGYAQIALMNARLINPKYILILTAAEMVFSLGWAFLSNLIYRSVFAPRDLLLVCGERPVDEIVEKFKTRKDRFEIVKIMNISEGLDAVLKEIPNRYQGVVVWDIPQHLRNNILKFCKFQLVINVAAVLVSAFGPFFGIEEPLKVTHLLFVNLVMDGLGAIMLGNEPALEKYMLEKPRRRDESIISKPMAVQIGVMGAWLTIMSFLFFLIPSAGNSVGDVMKDLSKGLFCQNFFDGNIDKLKTGYFVLFIVSALANGFNVRDQKYGIFKGLNLNPGFLRVMCAIIAVQAVIVNCGLIPLAPFQWLGKMFSCVPFGISGWVVVVLMALTMIPVDLIRKTVSGPAKTAE